LLKYKCDRLYVVGVTVSERSFRRIVYAIIESIDAGFRVKPVQEAIRRVLSRYRISDPIVDRRVSGIVYNVFRYQGLLEKIIMDLMGLDAGSLPRSIYSALLLAAYTSQIDKKMSSSLRRTFRRYIIRFIVERMGGRDLVDRIMGAVRSIYNNTWTPRSSDDRIMLEYKVSPELYKALNKAFREHDEDLELFLKSTFKIKHRSFRVNTLKASREAILKYLRDSGYNVVPGKYSGRAIRVYGGIGREIIRFIETGILIPQDEASMVAVEILDPKPNSEIADLCAAPGGKTTYLAEYTGLKSRIHSFEIFRDRAKRLRLLLERTGTINSVRVYVRDAREAPSILGRESMDYVLLDPPCSSTGAIARNPDVRWRYSEEDVEKLVSLQRELLEAAWIILRRNGRLLYTVCSVLPWEGEYIIREFLDKHYDARLIRLDKPFKQSTILPGTMRAWPHIHETTGFFYALIEKK
jgi:16S rRNA (cytosine967-C5)-methyltransferase